MRIEKSECLVEDEDPIVTIVEAESMASLLQAETKAYRDDDRLSPCHGHEMEFISDVSPDEGTLSFAPGDGGEYTIAEYRLIDE